MATSSLPPAPADGADDDVAPGPMHAARDHDGDDDVAVPHFAVSAREVINDCIDEVGDMTREGVAVVRQHVRTQPLTAVLAAFGLGLLLGRVGR